MAKDDKNKDAANTGNKGTGDFANDANDSNDIPDRDIVESRASTERERPRSMGDVWEERGVERDIPEEIAERRGEGADRTDQQDPIDPTGAEWENGPGVDVDDPNLSQLMAEGQVGDGKDALGRTDGARDPEEMQLDDPEELEEDEEA
ncbi:MAG TPA: hypothetical protein VHO02_00815 [Fibrobacteria bacterium]|jgi:hypothetical protein|nr:hypothetical protein [Fibrobacteria bacterium]